MACSATQPLVSGHNKMMAWAGQIGMVQEFEIRVPPFIRSLNLWAGEVRSAARRTECRGVAAYRSERPLCRLIIWAKPVIEFALVLFAGLRGFVGHGTRVILFSAAALFGDTLKVLPTQSDAR